MQLLNCRLDFPFKALEGSLVRIGPNLHHDIDRYSRRQQMDTSQLAQSPLHEVPRHSRLAEARNYQPNPAPGGRAFYMRERGSRRPDLEVLGPDALPLSRNTL